jgi:UV DNA damage repair endonuclease
MRALHPIERCCCAHFCMSDSLFHIFVHYHIQIASERERIDLEWQAERKEAKAAHLKALAEYEEDREREEVSGEADPQPCGACAAERDHYC